MATSFTIISDKAVKNETKQLASLIPRSYDPEDVNTFSNCDLVTFKKICKTIRKNSQKNQIKDQIHVFYLKGTFVKLNVTGERKFSIYMLKLDDNKMISIYDFEKLNYQLKVEDKSDVYTLIVFADIDTLISADMDFSDFDEIYGDRGYYYDSRFMKPTGDIVYFRGKFSNVLKNSFTEFGTTVPYTYHQLYEHVKMHDINKNHLSFVTKNLFYEHAFRKGSMAISNIFTSALEGLFVDCVEYIQHGLFSCITTDSEFYVYTGEFKLVGHAKAIESHEFYSRIKIIDFDDSVDIKFPVYYVMKPPKSLFENSLDYFIEFVGESRLMSADPKIHEYFKSNKESNYVSLYLDNNFGGSDHRVDLFLKNSSGIYELSSSNALHEHIPEILLNIYWQNFKRKYYDDLFSSRLGTPIEKIRAGDNFIDLREETELVKIGAPNFELFADQCTSSVIYCIVCFDWCNGVIQFWKNYISRRKSRRNKRSGLEEERILGIFEKRFDHLNKFENVRDSCLYVMAYPNVRGKKPPIFDSVVTFVGARKKLEKISMERSKGCISSEPKKSKIDMKSYDFVLQKIRCKWNI